MTLLLTLVSAARTSLALSPPTPVAVTGTAAPAGGNYTGFGAPMVNAAGQMAFWANLSGGNTAIFAGTPGSFQTVALSNTAAPSGGTFDQLNLSSLNSSGQLALSATLTGGSDINFYAGAAGSLQTVALATTPAPAGGNYGSLFGNIFINDTGRVAFNAGLTGGSSNWGHFAGLPGALQTVALEGTAAPAGGNYANFPSEPTLNSAGQVAFRTNLTGGSSPSGIFRGSPGSLQTVALEGTVAPAGGNFANFSNPALNSAGQVAFQAYLTGGSTDDGIFLGTPGSLQAVALKGTAAPAGGNYGYFENPLLNGSGQVAFRAALTDGTSSQGLFAGAPGSIQTVALLGSAAPGGGNYSQFLQFIGSMMVFNGQGQVAYTATLTGPGITPSNDLGLYAGLPGAIELILRSGDVIDVDPGIGVDNRTVQYFDHHYYVFGSGADGRSMSLSDQGLLAYRVNFTDGSSGLFTTQLAAVPEPGTIGVVAAGGLGLWVWRRKRRGLSA